jgi:hypothetical protein
MAPATADLDTILRNDGWTGATTNATKLAAARVVMEEAADQIEAVFARGKVPVMRSFKRRFWHFGQPMGRKVGV